MAHPAAAADNELNPSSRIRLSIDPKHVLAAIIAGAYLALALADGGFSIQVVSASTVLVWWVAIVALLFRVRPHAPVPATALAAGLCLAGLTALAALSLAWASNDGAAFAEAVRMAGYLGLFVLVVVITPPGGARTWLTGLAIGLAAVAAVALLSRLEPSLASDDQRIAEILPSLQGRLSFPIGYWNGLGACLALALVLLAWSGAQARHAWARAAAVGSLPIPALAIYFTGSRGAVFAAAAGILVLLVLGPSRARLLGGLTIAGAGSAVLVFLASRRGELVDGLATDVAAQQGDEILAVTIVVALAVGLISARCERPLERLIASRTPGRAVALGAAVVALAALVAADPIQRFEDFRSPDLEDRGAHAASRLTSGTGSGRYQYWGAAIDAFESDPLTGIGAGGYEAWWTQHGSLPRTIENAHSLFLESLAELGVGGLLLAVAIFAVPAREGLRRRASGLAPELAAALALLAAGAVSAGIDWTREIPAAFAPVIIAASLLTGSATLRSSARIGAGDNRLRSAGAGEAPGGVSLPRSLPGGGYGWAVGTLLAGWAAIWGAGIVFFAEQKLGDSEAAARRGDLVAAAHDARDARTLEPWSSEPYLQLALVQERAGDRGASATMNEAIERASDDWKLWLVATRLRVGSGDLAGARTALDRVRELNPRFIQTQVPPSDGGAP